MTNMFNTKKTNELTAENTMLEFKNAELHECLEEAMALSVAASKTMTSIGHLMGSKECIKCHHFVNKKYMHDEAKVKQVYAGMIEVVGEKIVHEYTCYTCKPKQTVDNIAIIYNGPASGGSGYKTVEKSKVGRPKKNK